MPRAARSLLDYKMDNEWREIFGSSIDLTACMVDILESFNMAAADSTDIGQPPDDTYLHRKDSQKDHEVSSVDSTHTCFSGDSGITDLERNSIWRNSSSSSGSAGSTGSHQSAILHHDGPLMDSHPVYNRRSSLSACSKTHFIIDEVIQTEKNYVEDLGQIWQGYLQPMRQSPIFSSEDLDLVFANLEEIWDFHKGFFAVLLPPDLSGPAYLAERVSEHSGDFEIYTEYCVNFPASVKHLAQLTKSHPDWFRDRQADLGHSLQLGTYLLKPIQRILKYHLLLQKLLDNCDFDGGDYQCIARAYDSMKNIAQKINDVQNQKERKIRFEELELLLQDLPVTLKLADCGELLLDDVFHLSGAKSERNLFLFENGLLIVKRKYDGTFSFKNYIAHSNLMLSEVIADNPLHFSVIAFDNPKVLTVIEAKTVDQKRVWTSRLKEMMLKKYGITIPEHVQQLVMQLGEVHRGAPVDSSPRRFRPNFFHAPAVPDYLSRRIVKSPARDSAPSKTDRQVPSAPRQGRRKTGPTLQLEGGHALRGSSETDITQTFQSYISPPTKEEIKSKIKSSSACYVSTDYIPLMKENEFMYEEIHVMDDRSRDDSTRRKSTTAVEDSVMTITPKRKARQKPVENTDHPPIPDSTSGQITGLLKSGFWNAFGKARQVFAGPVYKAAGREETPEIRLTSDAVDGETSPASDLDDHLDLDSFNEAVDALTQSPFSPSTANGTWSSSEGFYERGVDMLDSLSGGGARDEDGSEKEVMTSKRYSPVLSTGRESESPPRIPVADLEIGRRTGCSIKRKGAVKKRSDRPRNKSAPATPHATEKLTMLRHPKEPSTLIQQKIRTLEQQAMWESNSSVDKDFKLNDPIARRKFSSPAALAFLQPQRPTSSLSLDGPGPAKDNYVTMIVNKIESGSDLKLT